VAKKKSEPAAIPMSVDIFGALEQLEKEKGIPQSYMIERLTQALIAAYKKDSDSEADNVFVELTPEKMNMYVQKTVVDDVYDPDYEIDVREAQAINGLVNIGDLMNVPIKTRDFGRIAAQTAKQVIIQGIRG
jgi:N utilization substance protein A